MKTLTILVLMAALASPALAEKQPVADIVREQLEGWVPAGLGVQQVHVPAALAKRSYERDQVTVEVPRELRAGRPSVKVSVRGKSAVFVPVSIAKVIEVAVATHAIAAGTVIGAADVSIEQRAVAIGDVAPANAVVGATARTAIAAGAPVAAKAVALAPPLSRGTQVAIEMRRGAVRVRGTGILEAPARPGGAATARLAHTKTVVRGRLVGPATVVVEAL